MPETYSSYDMMNVVEDHVVQALKLDAYLKAGGGLAVATWDQELPEDAGIYQVNLLPAVAVECLAVSGPEEDVGFPSTVVLGFHVVVDVVVAGGVLSEVKVLTKRMVARLLRVLWQQHYADKQFVNLPAALAGADPGSATFALESASHISGELDRGGGLRGIGEVVGEVRVMFQIPHDT